MLIECIIFRYGTSNQSWEDEGIMRFIEVASKNIPEIKKAAPQRHRTRRALSFPLLRIILAALTAEKRGLTLPGCTHDFNYRRRLAIMLSAALCLAYNCPTITSALRGDLLRLET